ncbi:MAG: hypothetical protein GW780_03450 [Candidatus Aenigmarchaeota archaeon]|nr:hypothetical protein [Candidatus Aenigmarchaeota archaeon]NCO97426.1 hypothetical protein [Candidatus Aenigmarchaeota archaeon]NCS71196.1 hypothetical protein [Candidatus Aenigmarchaeota archaeon]
MIKFDEKEFRDKMKRNFEERIWFINRWCEYMKENSNKDWSSQQARLINAQIKE